MEKETIETRRVQLQHEKNRVDLLLKAEEEETMKLEENVFDLEKRLKETNKSMQDLQVQLESVSVWEKQHVVSVVLEDISLGV